MIEPKFAIGDQVQKNKGYKFPGEIRAAFTTRTGLIRYAVESTSPDTAGMLHIFNEDQLATDSE